MDISEITKPLGEDFPLPFKPTEEQANLVAIFNIDIPAGGTKLVCSSAILDAVAKHEMTLTTAAVFLHLCSSYGTDSDGTLRTTKVKNAEMIGLKLDAYVKVFRRLGACGLITPEGVVTHGINKNDWKNLAQRQNKAMTGRESRRGKVSLETLTMASLGTSTGWKMTFWNGIEEKLPDPGSWALYWQAFHLAGAHAQVDDRALDKLVEGCYQSDRRHLTRNQIWEMIGRLVESGAFRRTGNGVQLLNAFQEKQIAHVRKITGGAVNSGGLEAYIDSSYGFRLSIKKLHDLCRDLTKRPDFVRLRTLLPWDENFGKLYNGERETGHEMVDVGGEKVPHPKSEHVYLSPGDVDRYIREMVELTDTCQHIWTRDGWRRTSRYHCPELEEVASALYKTTVASLYPPLMLAYAILCRFAGVPVHERAAEILRSGAEVDDSLSYDALAYAVARYGLIDSVTQEETRPPELRAVMDKVLTERSRR